MVNGGSRLLPTPPDATHALLEQGRMWGSLGMRMWRRRHLKTFAGRYLVYGFDCPRLRNWRVDFLKIFAEVRWIVTNLPYKLATEFVSQALGCVQNVALLLKIQSQVGKVRRALFKEHLPKTIYVFSRRLKIVKSDASLKSSIRMCFAGFAGFV
jgi:hypothetical protein